MANYIYLFKICLIVAALIQLIVADTSTLERIRKHQEWLNRHNKLKSDKVKYPKWKSSFEPANLWRRNKPATTTNQNANINEAYAENETSFANSNINAGLKPTIITETTAQQINHTMSSKIPDALTTAESIIETKSLKPELATMRTTLPEVSSTTTTTTSTTSSTTSTTTKRPKPKVRPFPRWANWNPWSDCSRSCGGGIMHQTRKCIDRNSTSGRVYTSDTCVGLSKRYQICNDLPCPTESFDIRAYQCAAYNKVDFQGHQYNWEPYIKDDAECELNCKPLGMKYFATLNDTVIDGTPCQRPAEYYRSKSTYASRAMCVDGICKALLASGSIKGLYANSGSVSCGGLLCRPVTGIFTRDPLPEDAYVHVASIPAGASNISITELKNSANLLVLRTGEQKSIFNGENEVSESGSYEGAGATFDYHRIDGVEQGEGVTEWITCTGPISEPVELLVYSNILNPGIKYEYLLPIVSDSEENELSLESSDGFLRSGGGMEDGSYVSSTRSGRRRKFNWKVVGFSACTKSCGGGTQSPIVRCARENPVRYYSQRRCSHSEKPVLNENLLHCNTQPCPAYWRHDEWGECRCQHGESVRRRELSCVQELASSIVIHVDKAACMEEQPPSEKQCECPKSRRRNFSRYRMHPHVDSTNGTHLMRHRVPKTVGDAVWLMSEWNQYCSSACGPGIQYRTIFCDRPKTKTERCDARDIPENRRPCEQSACEMGEWFAGPWSPCNGDCFNLTRSRTVLCIKNQLITDDDECKLELRPQPLENCSHEENEYCAPRWHYSEWSECTKSCDGGTQRRNVRCLEYDEKQNALRESNKCRYAVREPIFRNCNAQKCEDLNNELLQNDEAGAACMDKFPNCKWAVQAKLCTYEYYRTNCCESCMQLH
ncbi:thrombospondin type-1 domain-containing protein 4-like isoform X1 [Drosophila grimshawi]|uniref:thrombospondin type-1 domain-containing protein 4-like isoform X1 n=1 Tax=Drosophila grimshawi TaxID=7222 RepID=UPI001C936CF4|nr:thrombospondin type-1 domain-containing protein 4-like isoform X1 [Drosophila grimshawi]